MQLTIYFVYRFIRCQTLRTHSNRFDCRITIYRSHLLPYWSSNDNTCTHTHTHICSPSVSHHAESIKAYFGSRVLLHACHQISSNQYWIGVIARKYCLVSWIFSFGTFIGSSSASECGLFVARAKKERNETKKKTSKRKLAFRKLFAEPFWYTLVWCAVITRAHCHLYIYRHSAWIKGNWKATAIFHSNMNISLIDLVCTVPLTFEWKMDGARMKNCCR